MTLAAGWWIRAARSVAGVLAGYAAMGGLITLVQETWLGGIGYHKSGAGVLALGGALTVLCAVAGGALAAWIAGRRPFRHAAAMCGLVTLETTWLIASGRTIDPLWFDVLAAGSLLLGLVAGAALVWRAARA